MAAEIPSNLFEKLDKSSNSRDSSTEKLDSNGCGGGGGGGSETGTNSNNVTDNYGYATLPLGMSLSQQNENDSLPVRFRRTGSERLKDGAKAFLRRVESIKSRRRKRQNRDGVVISGPQELDLSHITHKLSNDDVKLGGGIAGARSTPPSPLPVSPYAMAAKLPTVAAANDLKVFNDYGAKHCNRLSPMHYSHQSPGGVGGIHRSSQSTRTSPLHFFAANHPNIIIDVKSGDESSSYYSDASQESSGGAGSISGGGGGSLGVPKKRPSRTRRFLQKGSKVEDIGIMSDSECHSMLVSRIPKYFKDANSNNAESLQPPTAAPTSSESSMGGGGTKLARGGSLNLGKDSQRYRDGFKTRSFRSRSSCRKSDRMPGGGGVSDDDKLKVNAVLRWHSFQSHDRPDFLFKKCFSGRSTEEIGGGMPLAAMSCGQIQVSVLSQKAIWRPKNNGVLFSPGYTEISSSHADRIHGTVLSDT